MKVNVTGIIHFPSGNIGYELDFKVFTLACVSFIYCQID